MPIFAYMQEQITIPSYVNKADVARHLWPEMNEKSAIAKFHNKLKNECRLKFSDVELEKIKNYLK